MSQPTAMDNEQATAEVCATFTLGMHRQRFPELTRAEAQARLRLAAAIMSFDELSEAGENTLFAQARIETETINYRDALADLLRGETSDDV